MIRSFVLLCLLANASVAGAPIVHATEWRPPTGIEQIALWPEDAAILRPEVSGEERAVEQTSLVAGRPWIAVEDVVRPTLSVFPAKGINTGVAVVVFPGGGYNVLAIDLEGTEVCDWLVPLGITCAVLKYRVPGSGDHWDRRCNCRRTPPVSMALQDAQRAISLLRSRANDWGIDPHRIGVLGFSAGGHLSAAVSNEPTRRYAPVDAADEQGSRPDFSIVLYPGHLWDSKHLEKVTNLAPVGSATPPTFIVQAQDDPVDDVHESIVYYLALLKAQVPTELHLYAHGGHAFGLRPTAQPITRWPALVETWLHAIGMLPSPKQ
ncbi:alpha/beta hydrolase [Dokdonella sp.]|uniref:alpha/beta hydrolase n=1 Tax=Dokdonella sp. TaxID=2291710 RepID=UPI0025C53682|nr:alpha/beta hydrolase [Dokdonella sp.]